MKEITVKTTQPLSVAKQAKWCTLTPKGAPQMLYRIGKVKFNDGTQKFILYYLSSFDIWRGSDYSIKEFFRLPNIAKIKSII